MFAALGCEAYTGALYRLGWAVARTLDVLRVADAEFELWDPSCVVLCHTLFVEWVSLDDLPSLVVARRVKEISHKHVGWLGSDTSHDSYAEVADPEVGAAAGCTVDGELSWSLSKCVDGPTAAHTPQPWGAHLTTTSQNFVGSCVVEVGS